MSNDEKELLEMFRQMNKETKNVLLSNSRIAIITEECVKRQYGLLPGSIPQTAGGKPAAVGV